MTEGSGTPFFSKNGWPFVVISLVAILRGLLYLPTISMAGYKPYGLELIIGASPVAFGIYCGLWISAGLIGLVSAFRGNRLIALCLLVSLCGLWAFGYVLQFLIDLAHWHLGPGLTYLGGLTYASFGAALFRYPPKG